VDTNSSPSPSPLHHCTSIDQRLNLLLLCVLWKAYKETEQFLLLRNSCRASSSLSQSSSYLCYQHHPPPIPQPATFSDPDKDTFKPVSLASLKFTRPIALISRDESFDRPGSSTTQLSLCTLSTPLGHSKLLRYPRQLSSLEHHVPN
jgi:hypothetical protein